MTPKLTDLKDYSSIVKYLNDLLCNDIVKARLSQSHDCIDLSFSNNFKILIYASGSLTSKNQYFSSFNSLVFFDEKFSLLKDLITNQPIKLEYTNGSKELSNILKAFSSENVDNKIKNQQYWKLVRFELKELLSTHFKLGLDPRKEYFLFGNDQIRARYDENFTAPSIRNNQKIKIIDNSAILIENNQKRIIDIDHGGLYKTDFHIYLNSDIFHYIPCSKEEGDTVSYDSKTGLTTYKKRVLKDGINLTTESRLPYKNADQMIFNLSKNTESEFVLSDNLGEIQIHHPDLLFYFLS